MKTHIVACQSRFRNRSWLVPVACMAVCLAQTCIATTAQAATISAGWSLLATDPGSVFLGVPVTGAPIGSFDFTTGAGGDLGRGIGVQSTGTADTIVKRESDVTVAPTPGAGTTTIEMESLQLVTVAPVDLGAGLNFYYFTLQSQRGGPASDGTMTAAFNSDDSNRTFDWSMTVYYDVRIGSLNGPIVSSGSTPLQTPQVGAPSDPDPAFGFTDMSPGINRKLNGLDNKGDFWPKPISPPTGNDFPLRSTDPGSTTLNLGAALVPEPSTLALAAVGCAAVIFLGNKKRL